MTPSPLAQKDLFRHLLVLGATGSGKTRHVLIPLLANLLSQGADDPHRKCGAIIFDVKGDMTAHISAALQSAGRNPDDLRVIGRGGNSWFDPFHDIQTDCRTVAERLIAIVQSLRSDRSHGNYEDFWGENLRRFLQAAAVLATVNGYGDMEGPDGLFRAVKLLASLQSIDEGRTIPRATMEQVRSAASNQWICDRDAEMLTTFLQTDAIHLARTTWSVVCNYANAYVSCLLDSKIAEILAPSPARPHQFLPDQVMDLGLVVLINLSPIYYGPAARAYQMMLKTAFQQSALARYTRVYFDGKRVRPVNRNRPVCMMIDEFPALVTPGTGDDGDAYFIDKARESKVACLLSAQGISGLRGQFLHPSRCHHLLNNCSYKIFLSCDCPETLDYFSQAVPHEEVDESTLHLAPVDSPAIFHLPNYRFGSPRCWSLQGKSVTTRRQPRFDASVLRTLKTGEGILIEPGGGAAQIAFPSFYPCRKS